MEESVQRKGTPHALSPEKIQKLRKEHGVILEPELLTEIFDSLDAAMRWTIQKYGEGEMPKVYIGSGHKFKEGELDSSRIGAFLDNSSQGPGIAIRTQHLNQFRGSNLDSHITVLHERDIPFNSQMTLKQWIESFAVEETVHWLQHQNTTGLNHLPRPNERIPFTRGGGLPYLKQPHEREALRIVGELFREKYGENPYTELESFLESKTQH